MISQSEDLARLCSDATQCRDSHRARALGASLNSLELGLPRVLLLGNCTLDFLAQHIAYQTLKFGSPMSIKAGAYDQILQGLEVARCDIVVFMPWRDEISSLEQELEFWSLVWTKAMARGLKILQIGYDWCLPDGFGHASESRQRIHELNAELRRIKPAGAFFLDLDLVSGMLGRSQFYDQRAYLWTKDPLSQDGSFELARHVVAGLKTLSTGPRKVIVLDLDNTLWGGEVGELGWQNIGLSGMEGDAYLAFQKFLKALAARGVLLAVASKNDPVIAREALDKHPDMILRSQDFVAMEIHWGSKSESLVTISKALNLGLDSFVFFDDNSRERSEIREILPEVAVIEVSRDAVDYCKDLSGCLLFEAVEVTREDLLRTSRHAREETLVTTSNLESHFSGLEMVASITPLLDGHLARVVQLLGKTNQFNLTTRRFAASQVQAFAGLPDAYFRTLSMRDRLGDMGLVSLILAFPNEESLRVDTWLMSCRVMGRTVENFFFNHLLEYCRENGFKYLQAEYIPSPRNGVVSELLPALGFKPLTGGLWQLSVKNAKSTFTYVK